MTRLWHVTTRSCADSILIQGFEPRIGPRAVNLEPDPAVYFFPSVEAMESACWGWLSDAFSDVEEDLIALEVELDLSRFPTADREVDFEVQVFASVPADSIVEGRNIDTGEMYYQRS